MWQYNHFEQNELYHYGVPGMKWGHRKQRDIQGNGRVRSGGAASNGSGSSGAKNAPKTREQAKSDATNQRERGKKVAAGVLIGIGAAAVTGAAIVAARNKGIQIQAERVKAHNINESMTKSLYEAKGLTYQTKKLSYPKGYNDRLYNMKVIGGKRLW